MPWQRQVLDVALEVDDAGDWAYPTVVITVPRQAGKSTLITPTACHRALVGPDRLIWMTAQTRQDARDAFMTATKSVLRSPLGSRLILRRSNGSEELMFPNGSSYRIFAPVEDALHGKTNHLVFVDEAWAFDALAGAGLLQAILPTFTTTGGQLWIVSSAGTAQSEWLREFVQLGRQSADRPGARMAYFEWSIGDDVDPSDLDAVIAAHPATGITLRRDALEQAALTMSPGEFTRAYGNRWTQLAERIIPEREYRAALSGHDTVPEVGTMALAYDVDVDEGAAAIAAAWVQLDGRRRVELLEFRPGAAWLPERLDVIDATHRPIGPVAYDGMGPGAALAPALARRTVALRALTAAEYAGACAGFLRALMTGTLAVTVAPAMDAAAGAIARRAIGDRWGWSRRASAVSSAPIVAATLALWALEESPGRFEIH